MCCNVHYNVLPDVRKAIAMKKQKQPEILQDHNQDSERPTANWTLGKALPFIWKETCQAMFKDESMERVKLRPDNIRQITLTFQDHTLSALQRDEGQRSIMFLHGTPGNARKWDWYLRNCPKGYTMTAPDRPGFGLNTPRKNGYHIENQSELMQEWLKDISKTKEKRFWSHIHSVC